MLGVSGDYHDTSLYAPESHREACVKTFASWTGRVVCDLYPLYKELH
jgi:hypothetical protein